MDIFKVCLICGLEKPITKFDKHTSGSRRNICEPCRNIRKRAYLWICFLREFDFRCSCCGEDDIRFLTLDHVLNDGSIERLDTKDNIPILRRAKDEGFDRKRYDCLCWNCNCAKNRNNGICPHKTQDKEEHNRIYKKSAEHVMKKGREQIYQGKSILERNRSAQVKHNIVTGKHDMTPEQIQELITILQQNNS